jgi:hypothetical protein
MNWYDWLLIAVSAFSVLGILSAVAFLWLETKAENQRIESMKKFRTPRVAIKKEARNAQ